MEMQESVGNNMLNDLVWEWVEKDVLTNIRMVGKEIMEPDESSLWYYILLHNLMELDDRCLCITLALLIMKTFTMPIISEQSLLIVKC